MWATFMSENPNSFQKLRIVLIVLFNGSNFIITYSKNTSFKMLDMDLKFWNKIVEQSGNPKWTKRVMKYYIHWIENNNCLVKRSIFLIAILFCCIIVKYEENFAVWSTECSGA